MGVEKAPPPIISTLNPNASVFVPASLHVLSEKDGMPDDVVPPPTDDRIAPGPYSDEWWHLMETDSAFRHQYLSMCPNEQEKNILAEEFDVSADSDDFFSYQEKLALQEEEEELARKLAEIDYLEDEDLSLTTTNNCKDVKSPKQQLQE
uniref:Ataxin-2 C-terminal domain-containing protein n=1 Tax=Physcomitrium patens TaxID=3218 RepID=A0A7I4DCC7_PHYPA